MRFPWLQLESDFLEAKAGDLAALLGISRYEAIGRVADVWAWALNRSPKESPPDGRVEGESAERLVEAAAGWTSRTRRGAFVHAALEVGLLERTTTGLRVRGMSRYATAHENATIRSEKARAAAEARWAAARAVEAAAEQPVGTAEEMPAACSEHAPSTAQACADAMLGDAKTQTQTQTQKTPPTEAGSAGAPPAACGEVLELKPTVPPGKPVRRPSFAEGLFVRLEASRQEACAQAGAEYVPEGWHPKRINAQLGFLAKASPEARAAFEAAWGAYLDEAANASRDPPFSLGFFLSSKSTWESRARRAGGNQ
jgi:hypothetical protein